MDSSVSLKDEILFLRACHHISNAVYVLAGKSLYLDDGLEHGSPIFLWSCSRTGRGKITVSAIGLSNRPKYCLMFIVYTLFTNMAPGRIIQTGGPHACRGLRVGAHGVERLLEEVVF